MTGFHAIENIDLKQVSRKYFMIIANKCFETVKMICLPVLFSYFFLSFSTDQGVFNFNISALCTNSFFLNLPHDHFAWNEIKDFLKPSWNIFRVLCTRTPLCGVLFCAMSQKVFHFFLIMLKKPKNPHQVSTYFYLSLIFKSYSDNSYWLCLTRYNFDVISTLTILSNSYKT